MLRNATEPGEHETGAASTVYRYQRHGAPIGHTMTIAPDGGVRFDGACITRGHAADIFGAWLRLRRRGHATVTVTR